METIPTQLPIDHINYSKCMSNRIFGLPVSNKATVLMALAAAIPVTISSAHADRMVYRNKASNAAKPFKSKELIVRPLITAPTSRANSSIAQKEIARRFGLLAQANEALMAGRKAYTEKNYEESVKQYKVALSLLPPGPALADRRASYTAHLADASVALAQEYRNIGKADEARVLLEDVILKDSTNLAAKKQLAYLEDPIRTNPALTYEHTENVDKVRRHLYKGEGYYNLGKYDEAETEFNKILLIDKYNKAARRWLEKVDNTRSDYYRSAYGHTRAHLLAEIDKAWEMAVPKEGPTFKHQAAPSTHETGVVYLQNKLNNIIIPVINFDDITVEEALDILRSRAREIDPEGVGLNFIIRKPSVSATESDEEEGLAEEDSGANVAPDQLRIKELKLRNVPLGTVLQYICDSTRLRYKLDEHAVILLPLNTTTDDFYTRSFIVPPDFLAKIDDGNSGGGDIDDDPFKPTAATGGTTLTARKTALELLKSNGVAFPDGTFANYIPASSTLVVRNTLGNIDIIEQIIDVIINKGPRQVRILTKFIEISQEGTDELSFDWILSPTALTGATSLTGGTIGSGTPRIASDFTSPNVPGISQTGSNAVTNIGTAGLRSGDYAVSRNSIDALLNNPNRNSQNTSVAPGILSLTGLYGSGQVKMIMRGLAQKKGADIMTAPSVLARSGEKATIEVIREFIYPTEYEPPELPNSVGTTTTSAANPLIPDPGQVIDRSSISSFPVTPATPTAFETRNTGVTLEIEPTISEDNYTIDLRLAPEIVEFEGFINYGSPIQSPGTDSLGTPVNLTITENRIEMPVFATRRVNTALTIYDGYTVSIGGLMSEHVQNVEDKVPILGDLPLIGRLFQSRAENHIKSNLIIFVTAEIIDAAGARINKSIGDEEAPADLPGVTSGGDGLDILPKNN